MDIWEWVEKAKKALRQEGNHRLADIMHLMPSWSVNDQHDKVAGVYHEALQLARQSRNKWIEIFVRHWYLQSEVLKRHNVKNMSTEALALLDFCHQEDTKDCPQSICAVQDYAKCFAKKDGLAYAQERIDVSTETLARIDPTWPCYRCIGSELIYALDDNGQTSDAIDMIQKLRRDIAQHNPHEKNDQFALTEADFLIELGRMQEAEKIIREADNPVGGSSFLRYKTASLALVLALQGKYAEALEARLSFDEVVVAQSHFHDWAKVSHLLAKEQAIDNDWALNVQFNQLINCYIDHGVQRSTLKLLAWQAELAFERQGFFALQQAIACYVSIIPDLRADLGASETLQQLQSWLDELIKTVDFDMPDTVDELLNHDFEDAEQALSMLSIAHEQWPEISEVTELYGNHLLHYDYNNLAFSIAKKSLAERRDQPTVLGLYGRALQHTQQIQTLTKEYQAWLQDESLSDKSLNTICWVLAHHYHTYDNAQALNYTKQILVRVPEAANTLEFAARLEVEQGQYEKALTHWNTLITLYPENTGYHWDRMIPATLCDQWDSVHASLHVLEVDFGVESGPINMEREHVRIQMTDDDGAYTLLALRTGPVCARIIQFTQIDQPQYYSDTVVFNAAPLNELDVKDDEGYYQDTEGHYTLLYNYVATKIKSDYQVFDLDGVKPSDEQLKVLIDWFEAQGIDHQIRSSDEYALFDAETEQEYPGIYLYFALTPEAWMSVHQYLADFTATLPQPLIWPGLVEKLNLSEVFQTQLAIQGQYDMA